VSWRWLACCCSACKDLRWDDCEAAEFVGRLEIVVEPGGSLYK
jgi:hypothetical protein